MKFVLETFSRLAIIIQYCAYIIYDKRCPAKVFKRAHHFLKTSIFLCVMAYFEILDKDIQELISYKLRVEN